MPASMPGAGARPASLRNACSSGKPRVTIAPSTATGRQSMMSGLVGGWALSWATIAGQAARSSSRSASAAPSAAVRGGRRSGGARRGAGGGGRRRRRPRRATAAPAGRRRRRAGVGASGAVGAVGGLGAASASAARSARRRRRTAGGRRRGRLARPRRGRRRARRGRDGAGRRPPRRTSRARAGSGGRRCRPGSGRWRRAGGRRRRGRPGRGARPPGRRGRRPARRGSPRPPGRAGPGCRGRAPRACRAGRRRPRRRRGRGGRRTRRRPRRRPGRAGRGRVASSIRSGAADSSWSSIDSASRIPPAASRAMRWTAAGSAVAAVGGEDPGELALDLGDGQAPDVEALEARQDRRREARRLGRGEHEDDEVGRLLERLQQRVPGVLGDLVRLVEDVDLAPELAGRIRQALAQVADVVDAAVAGGVDLDEVERRALADRDARRAAVAGVAVLEVRAVDRLGEDPGERGLAGAARPDEQDRVADPVGPDGVAQRLDDGFLADDLAERLGAPAAIEGLVRDGRASRPPPVWADARSRSAVHPPST